MKSITLSQSRSLLLVLASLFLSACERGPDGPNEQAFKTALMLEVGSQYAVKDINVLAHQAVGTETEPRVRTRLEAELELSEPMYSVAEELFVQEQYNDRGRNYKILTVSQQAGTKLMWKGVAEAVFIQDSWQIKAFRQDEITPPTNGKFRANVDGPNVIQGSEDEQDLRASIRKKQEAEEAARAERQRLELEAARLRDEKQRQELAALKNFRLNAAGLWVSTLPVLSDNAVFSDNGTTLGYEINIPSNDILEGMASITVRSLQPVKGQLLTKTFEGFYQFKPGSNSFTISEVTGNDLRLQRQTWRSGKIWQLQMTDTGLKASSNFRRTQLRMDLESKK
jgi:hypothetical protein